MATASGRRPGADRAGPNDPAEAERRRFQEREQAEQIDRETGFDSAGPDTAGHHGHDMGREHGHDQGYEFGF